MDFDPEETEFIFGNLTEEMLAEVDMSVWDEDESDSKEPVLTPYRDNGPLTDKELEEFKSLFGETITVDQLGAMTPGEWDRYPNTQSWRWHYHPNSQYDVWYWYAREQHHYKIKADKRAKRTRRIA